MRPPLLGGCSHVDTGDGHGAPSGGGGPPSPNTPPELTGGKKGGGKGKGKGKNKGGKGKISIRRPSFKKHKKITC